MASNRQRLNMNKSQLATKRVVLLIRKGWSVHEGKLKPPPQLFGNKPKLFNLNESEQLQSIFGKEK